MSLQETIKLNDGNSIPAVGLGTWLSEPEKTKQAVVHAVKTGYRHIDEAKIYQNQHEVGNALKELIPSVVKREDLFIVSKLWNSAHKPQNVEAGLDDTLKALGLDYLDLYLIHWPVAFDTPKPNEELMPKSKANPDNVELDLKTTLVDTWKAMIDLQKKGKVKSIGVSNFQPSHIEGIIKATGVVPAVHQFELHPLLPQDDLIKFCNEKGIHCTSYSPLSNPGGYGAGKDKDLLQSKTVKAVADKLGATPGQVLLAWGRHRGYSVIPKSTNPGRIEENYKQIKLSKEDFEKVSSVLKDEFDGKHQRFNIAVNYTPCWPINVFGEDIEFKKAVHQINVGA